MFGLGKSISTLKWKLYRHGFSFKKTWYRLFKDTESLSKVLIVSIPKSGTNIIDRAICLSPYYSRVLKKTLNEENIREKYDLKLVLKELKKGQVLASHLHQDVVDTKLLKQNNITTIFVYRDPKDLLVSFAHFVYTEERHYHYSFFKGIDDIEKRMKILIKGDEEAGIRPFNYHLENFIKWADIADVSIQYENIFERENGSVDISQDFIEKIKKIDHKNFDEDYINLLRDQLFFTKSPTFRKSKTSQWEKVFSDEVYELFKKECGYWVSKYGYEIE